MRIRLQILLGVAPVFLVLGLVVAALNYTTRREETYLALREDVYTLTAAMTEFLSSDTVRAELGSTRSVSTPFGESLQRLMKENPIERIVLRSLDPKQAPIEFGDLPEPATMSESPHSTMEARNSVLFSPILDHPGGDSFIRAMAPLRTAAGPFGLLTLDIDANAVVRGQHTILLESLAFLVGILSCGLLVSWTAGRLVTRGVERLSKATDVVASGCYDWRVQPGWLRELNDLSNTFNTMTSLLEEILSKTKRAVIEGEQFRRPEDLADSFSETLWRRGHARLGPLSVSLMRLGRPGNGDFLALWKQDGQARIVMGRMLVSGEFEAAVLASAAFSLIQEEIRTGGPGFVRAHEIFHFKFWDLVSWNVSSPTIEVSTFRFGQAEPVRRRVNLERGQVLTLHSLEGEWARRLELYVRILKGMDGNRLAEELAGILKVPAGGGVIILTAP
ncbi:MAG: hypothetical protein P8020_06525 [Acidobacteriota bacterium]